MSSTEVDEGFDPDDYDDPDPRLPRGYLALDVYNVIKDYANGDTKLEEGRFMTPYVVMRIMMDETPERRKPSTGAIAAVFHRWEEWGFAEFRKNPFAFTEFTEKGKTLGLEGINKERRDFNKQQRAQNAKPKD